MSRGLLRNCRGEKHPARAAVIADLVQLARRQSRIGDDRPCVDPARSQQQGGKRDAVFADNHHPVARPDAERLERRAAISVTCAIQFAIAPGGAVLDSATMIGGFGNMPPSLHGCGAASPRRISAISIASDSFATTTSQQRAGFSAPDAVATQLTFFFRTRQSIFSRQRSFGPRGNRCPQTAILLENSVYNRIPTGR
jgi:hypothetical protein